ncbi:helix-turn-helix domain-containing protein [Cupriavidus basilensis]|uniref:HTH cro/C1-type domain-containing protein n=1 Tax=Cupriavidus basilensis TaxID=68895 RepID=A0A0C4YG92_9BURK|nr:helix-turn-helix transcriptional regulator [Cupriavidus basilensis]AJG21968.1 hypothetical protein RR42_s0372 [Cupriavidus basilensis]
MDYPIKAISQLRPILQGFRKASHLTQAEVAAKLGITQQSYAQLEANPAAASIERLYRTLQVLGVELVLSPVASQAAMRPSACQSAPGQGTAATAWVAQDSAASAKPKRAKATAPTVPKRREAW